MKIAKTLRRKGVHKLAFSSGGVRKRTIGSAIKKPKLPKLPKKSKMYGF